LAARVPSKHGLPRGVCIKKSGKYAASCSGKYLGVFNSAMAAHSAWQHAMITRITHLSHDQCGVVTDRLRDIIRKIEEDNRLNKVTIKI
jgi:hypothetical protein